MLIMRIQVSILLKQIGHLVLRGTWERLSEVKQRMCCGGSSKLNRAHVGRQQGIWRCL